MSPATMRLPATPRLKATPSSDAQTTISSGWRVRTLPRVNASRTPIDASVPRSPSKLPPDGTESMWEPNRIGARDGSAPGRCAKMLPAGSTRGVAPAARINPVTYARPARSASEYAMRVTPSAKLPPPGRPNMLSASSRARSAAESTDGVRAGSPRTAATVPARPARNPRLVSVTPGRPLLRRAGAPQPWRPDVYN